MARHLVGRTLDVQQPSQRLTLPPPAQPDSLPLHEDGNETRRVDALALRIDLSQDLVQDPEKMPTDAQAQDAHTMELDAVSVRSGSDVDERGGGDITAPSHFSRRSASPAPHSPPEQPPSNSLRARELPGGSTHRALASPQPVDEAADAQKPGDLSSHLAHFSAEIAQKLRDLEALLQSNEAFYATIADELDAQRSRIERHGAWIEQRREQLIGQFGVFRRG
ncbi:hypothetical protein HK105_205170 [Polyrhizophydium stewartii]|uniref:Uncharacterized protein n=1 Tax=Polyrhizophydium stewartii TaxID=2732419 RepID=A0ABR4N768_9FUNG